MPAKLGRNRRRLTVVSDAEVASSAGITLPDRGTRVIMCPRLYLLDQFGQNSQNLFNNKIYLLKNSDLRELRELRDLFVEWAKREWVAPKSAPPSIPQMSIGKIRQPPCGYRLALLIFNYLNFSCINLLITHTLIYIQASIGAAGFNHECVNSDVGVAAHGGHPKPIRIIDQMETQSIPARRRPGK